MSEYQDLGRLLACCGHLGRQYGENLLRQRGYDVTPVQTRMLVYLSRCQSEVNQRDLERELRLRDYFAREELAVMNAVPAVLAVW